MKKWKNIKVVALAAIVTGFLDGTIHGASMGNPTVDLSSSDQIKVHQQMKAVVELSGILDHFEGIETEGSPKGEAETLKRVCSQKVKEVKRLTDEAMQVLKDKGYLTDQPDHTGATEAEKAITTMKRAMNNFMEQYRADYSQPIDKDRPVHTASLMWRNECRKDIEGLKYEYAGDPTQEEKTAIDNVKNRRKQNKNLEDAYVTLITNGIIEEEKKQSTDMWQEEFRTAKEDAQKAYKKHMNDIWGFVDGNHVYQIIRWRMYYVSKILELYKLRDEKDKDWDATWNNSVKNFQKEMCDIMAQEINTFVERHKKKKILKKDDFMRSFEILATANNESQNGGIDSHQSLKLLGYVMWEEYKSQIFLKKACEKLIKIMNLSINAQSNTESVDKKQEYLRNLYELGGVRHKEEIQDFFNRNDPDNWWELFGDIQGKLTSEVSYLAHDEVFNETEKEWTSKRINFFKKNLKETDKNKLDAKESNVLNAMGDSLDGFPENMGEIQKMLELRIEGESYVISDFLSNLMETCENKPNGIVSKLKEFASLVEVKGDQSQLYDATIRASQSQKLMVQDDRDDEKLKQEMIQTHLVKVKSLQNQLQGAPTSGSQSQRLMVQDDRDDKKLKQEMIQTHMLEFAEKSPRLQGMETYQREGVKAKMIQFAQGLRDRQLEALQTLLMQMEGVDVSKEMDSKQSNEVHEKLDVFKKALSSKQAGDFEDLGVDLGFCERRCVQQSEPVASAPQQQVDTSGKKKPRKGQKNIKRRQKKSKKEHKRNQENPLKSSKEDFFVKTKADTKCTVPYVWFPMYGSIHRNLLKKHKIDQTVSQ